MQLVIDIPEDDYKLSRICNFIAPGEEVAEQ